MATTTPNLSLTKPLVNEPYSLNVWNRNSDLVDTAIGNLRTSVNTAQNTANSANTRFNAFVNAMAGNGNFPLSYGQTIAFGSNIKTNRTSNTLFPSIMVGHNSITTAGGTITIGIGAETYQANDIAIGFNAIASGPQGTALGYGTYAGWESLALGSKANAYGRGASAIGHNARALGNYSTAIGDNAYTSNAQPNVIQLGSNSISELRCLRSLTVTSDERDKTDIVQISKGLDFINALEPIQYVSNLRSHYIEKEKQIIEVVDEETGEIVDTKEIEVLSEINQENLDKYGLCEYNRAAHAAGLLKGERKRVGLKAQNIQKALENVYGTADYANIVNDNFHDLTEPPPEGVESQLSVAYDIIIPFLIDAVQSLSKDIEELKQR